MELGCINDVHNVKQFLTTLYGFNEVFEEWRGRIGQGKDDL